MYLILVALNARTAWIVFLNDILVILSACKTHRAKPNLFKLMQAKILQRKKKRKEKTNK